MLPTNTRRFELLALFGFAAALTGCTAVPEITQDVVTAHGTVVTSDGAAVPVQMTSASASMTFDYNDPSALDATLEVPTSDGGTVRVDVSAHVSAGNLKNVDLASIGAQV